MGVPKALLRFGGRSALSLIIDSCLSAGYAPAVIVLGADARRVIEAAGDLRSANIVIHEEWASGRTSSLKAGLRTIARLAPFLIVPVDHPLIRAGTLASLRKAGETAPPHCRVVVPIIGGRRGHPVLCDASLRNEFLALGDEEPARAVTGRDPGRGLELDVSDPGVLETLDAPEDCEQALRRWEMEEAERS